jgi:Tfp pilus assembly protein PilN
VKPANLARRPFRNERLPNVLFALAGVAVLGLTVRHALVIRALMPGQTSALHDEVTQLEKRSERLRAEQAGLRDLAPDPRALARWVLVKDLVDRRAFSWTGLFARLEALLPEGARLVSVAPSLHHGEIILDVQAVMRSPEVGWQFIRALEENGDFDQVFPLSESEAGEFHYTMRYRPREGVPADPARSSAAADPSPSPQRAAVPPAGSSVVARGPEALP